MEQLLKTNITVKRQEDNVLFLTDCEKNGERLDFNLNDLVKIFENVTLYKQYANTLSFSENGLFDIAIESYEDKIRLSTNEMFALLYDLFFNKITIPSNDIIAYKISEVVQKKMMSNLRLNESIDNGEVVSLCGYYELYLRGSLVAVGKNAFIESRESTYKIILDGAVGLLPGMNELVTVVIYHNDLKITLENCVINTTSNSLDIHYIELSKENKTYNSEIVTDENKKTLKYSNLKTIPLVKIASGLTINEAAEKISSMNTIDELTQYSIINKQIISKTLETSSLVMDDDFDDLF